MKVSTEKIQKTNNCSYTQIIGQDAKVNLTTPGYPNGYKENLNCSWTFMPEDKNSHVVLEVYDIDLEETTECTTDYIKVESSSNLISWYDEKKLCKNRTTTSYRLPEVYVDGTPNLRVKFITDRKFYKNIIYC